MTTETISSQPATRAASDVPRYYKTDETGVVFILNLSNVGEARALLEELPLGQAGMMEFELISLGPPKPLGLLLAEPPKVP
jgi:hypothetical protein